MRALAVEVNQTDPFTDEIIRNYLLSTVREMITVTRRAAYSTCFSEAADFSCAIFDEKGRLVAQAGGNPVHFAGLEDEVAIILEKAGELEDGDVLLHNDPYEGADHQSDVVLAMPIFWKGELVGLSVNRGHWMDIGGMFAGGYGVASHVVQEALIIPTCKLYRAGQLSREVQEFILKNVRMPRLIWGDIQAQIASARAAADRVRELVDRYGLDQVKSAVQHTLDYAHRRFREGMDALPDAMFHASDVLDDDGFGNGPFTINITIHKSPDKIIVDFDGSSPQAPGAANCSYGAMKAATYTALKAIIDPDMPFNSGILDLVEIHAPLGSMVNPTYPAPVCVAPADPCARTCETVIKCWAEAAPERIAAGGYSTGIGSTGWGYTQDGDEFLWFMFGPGGCGARKDRDGLTMEWNPTANCPNESLEVWESRYPVRFVRRELRTDSAGAGRTRGGVGDVRVMECLVDTVLSTYVDRYVTPPWSMHGGNPGECNAFALERGGAEYTFPQLFDVGSPSKFSNVKLRVGDLFVVKTGGGGGFGPPEERDPDRVAWDAKNRYVSAEAARNVYRVALNEDFSVDLKGTKVLRGG
jgi:N-methylhydantoinase B